MALPHVDLDQFWKDDALAHKENCFSADAPQVALGIKMSDEVVFAELGEEGQEWGYTPYERRIDLNKRYNDKAEQIVGRRLLREEFTPPEAELPAIKRIGEVFGGSYNWYHSSEWLESDINTSKALEAMLDRVDKMDMRSFMLPADWDEQKKMKFEQFGTRPARVHNIRGPVTLACSIYGIENLIFLILDEPDLAKRFSDTIANVIITMAEIMDGEVGSEATGFAFLDDNCCMLNPEMYEFFGYPILKKVFDRFCPEPSHYRYQHSDSEMGHLLPILSRLNFHGVNFGPTILMDKIREYMPRTRIDGCIAPYTFMNNNTEKIIAEVKRDCHMAKQHGRGLNLATAGSVNNGSLLTSLRTAMWAIVEYGRY